MRNCFWPLQNAKLGNIPHYEHDDALFLEKREQMHYNVEDRARIEAKYQMPPRSKLLRPDFHHHTSRSVWLSKANADMLAKTNVEWLATASHMS